MSDPLKPPPVLEERAAAAIAAKAPSWLSVNWAVTPAARREKRRRLGEALLDGKYALTLPDSVKERLKSVEAKKTAKGDPYAEITFRSGGVVRDFGDRLTCAPKNRDDFKAMAAMVAAHGWSRVELTGSDKFKAAMAKELAKLKPPVSVIGQEPPPNAPGAVAPAAVDKFGEPPEALAPTGPQAAPTEPVNEFEAPPVPAPTPLAEPAGGVGPAP